MICCKNIVNVTQLKIENTQRTFRTCSLSNLPKKKKNHKKKRKEIIIFILLTQHSTSFTTHVHNLPSLLRVPGR